MTETRKFRKRPVVIEAIRLTADNLRECCQFVGRQNISSADPDKGTFSIYTREGSMRAEVGDWIIKGVLGEFYPCKPDLFDATYDPADALLAQPPAQGEAVSLQSLLAACLYRDNGYDKCRLCRGWAHMDEPLRHDADCLVAKAISDAPPAPLRDVSRRLIARHERKHGPLPTQDKETK